MIDSDDLLELLQCMEMGEWASALELTRKLANFELRQSIRAAQRRNFELYQTGKFCQAEYDDNRRTLNSVLKAGTTHKP